MILLDTNVISEPLHPLPDARVLAWLDAQPMDRFYLSAVTIAEIRFGIATMPEGRRRQTLQARVEHEVLPLFSGRILSFDIDASGHYARLMAKAKSVGWNVSEADGFIAATAAAHGLIVATRDTGPFNAAGLAVINPWTTEP